MLTLQGIMKAINTKLKNKFNIEINDNDVKKGFDRPSFFVKFDNLSKTDYQYMFERRLTVRIYFFPTNRHKYQIEVLEVQQDIETLFHLGLKVEERFVKIVDDIQSEVIDGVLMITFDLSYSDSSYEEDEYEKMEELNLNAGY
ncbi:hypothetical protein SAMN05660297_02748 [Natronincola peptidivorans]|uniref:Phage protein n=1 Tax=Natronincola peptidivorans TaxID=426128 RepID=A0A1I0FBG8_9FIRM|nr:hypothetical protein [Natronincola peptidivorans]SET55570.1 hypothetical protein SAMN05660297_02748 [Natronincola peptidivorans]